MADSREQTVFYRVAIGCGFLLLTNWTIIWESKEFENSSATSNKIDLSFLGTLACALVLFQTCFSVWKLVRLVFGLDTQIPKSVRLWGDWTWLLLLLPFFAHARFHFGGDSSDEIAVTFGGFFSLSTLLLASILIMMLQLKFNLESELKNT